VSATVRIYNVVKGFDQWLWLCRRCVEDMKTDGWGVKENREPPHALQCDGEACKQARELRGKLRAA
jgi:hypothetical protein